MTTSNDTRAGRAQAALQSYVETKGEVFENSSSEIADLMADLLHFAARLLEGENTPEETVDRCLRLARMTPDDPIWQDLWHGVIWPAFIAEARKAGTWPEAETVKQAAYRLFETERRRGEPTPPTPASPSLPPPARPGSSG